MSKVSEHVRIIEVGPRDGLQNEKKSIPIEWKREWISGLALAGLQDIEVGAFVRSDRVPQMDSSEILAAEITKRILDIKKARSWVLVPNRVGLERALSTGVKNIAVFTAATDGFNQANIGKSVKESLQELREVIATAKASRLRVRGYISTVWGCPFDGRVKPKSALKVMERLLELGVDEVSLGDTIGVAHVAGVRDVVGPALKLMGKRRAALAVHFHDTRGQALVNTLSALELGVSAVDSSAAGLGGCPYAPGATGNLATEDLIYLLHGLGVGTGIDLDAVARASLQLLDKMGQTPASRYLTAYRSHQGPSRAEGIKRKLR